MKCWSRTCGWLSACAVLIAGASSAHSQPVAARRGAYEFLTPTDAAILKGDQANSKGNWREALQAYDEASEAANSLPISDNSEVQRETKAEALISTGRKYMQLPRDAADPEVLSRAIQQAEQVFQNAVEVGTGQQQSIGRIHLADVYMRLGRFNAALGELQLTDREQIPAEQRFVLDYNIGRAYQESGEVDRALDAYRQALSQNPQFQQAADRIVEATAAELSPQRLASSADFLMDAGYTDQASELALRTISAHEGEWSEPVVVEAVAVLLRCWAWKYDGPGRVAGIIADAQGEILERAGISRPGVEDFRSVSSANVRVSVAPLQEETAHRHPDLSSFWTESLGSESSLRRGWSVYITAVARWHDSSSTRPAEGRNDGDRRHDAERALALYLLAWGVDRDNLEACNGVMSVMESEQNSRLFDRYFTDVFESLFSIKSGMYIANPRTDEDWQSIMQFHIVLGSLLVRADKLGGPGEDPRTAIGQFELGERAERRAITLSNGEFIGSPFLYFRLGDAYEKADAVELAADAWMTAIERSIATDDIHKAGEALERAVFVVSDDDESRSSRLQALRDRLPGVSARIAP